MVITFIMIQKTLGKQGANFFLFLQEEGHIITTKDVHSVTRCDEPKHKKLSV